MDGIHDRAAELHEGDRVQLFLESKNKYDNKAILVKNEKGDKLGYIPRVKNEVQLLVKKIIFYITCFEIN